ncbi:DUF6296 family protein [Kitasatospora sp. NPDC058965]|uniref:DUF6296 family protein n=1 Tax=Kitasatospora sp. NPDC058965 TaxID=3346682 RepID=UPI003681EF3E
MGTGKRYELTFGAARLPGDVVVVAATGATGPGGHPVYADPTGIVRAEISERGEVRMLASGGEQDLRTPVRVRLLA